MPKIVKHIPVQVYEATCSHCKTKLEFAQYEMVKVMGINSSENYFECPVCLTSIKKTKDMVLVNQSRLKNYKDKIIDTWNYSIGLCAISLNNITANVARLQVITPEMQEKMIASKSQESDKLVSLYVWIPKDTFDKAESLTSESFAKALIAEFVKSVDLTEVKEIITSDSNIKIELFVPFKMLQYITELANEKHLTVNSVFNALILKYLDDEK